MPGNNKSSKGLLIALTIICIWLLSFVLLMQWHFSFKNPLAYLAVFWMMHLYTGLFITAHDAMHGTVTHDKKVNTIIGQLCTALYAVFPYQKLYIKHHKHHKNVHTDDDPDFSEKGFLGWYVKFISEYLSWWQIVLMAIIYNLLKLWISEANLLLFWVFPSLLSTLQLFYFGTWLPHHGEHTNKHFSRTQSKNHFVAFISCYFFGYHYEHHETPHLPWWKLWKTKSVGH
ncbi:fatty acid desaturase [Pedobacter sp. HMF7647]|uniref:Fatty acid desaturase n=1 Tax=Hufsiella arboris TaxID=2695275 RepID=A0A7K1YBA4_9SPHI|nr:fatty acid desaturase [Hufsiella arboris]MXV51856.1 fatty acid desaturase [Hufsiella arboris]